MNQWLLLQFLVLLMMDAESVRNMYSDLAVTNKQYCQSCILLVLYVIRTYDAQKLKHKIVSSVNCLGLQYIEVVSLVAVYTVWAVLQV